MWMDVYNAVTTKGDATCKEAAARQLGRRAHPKRRIRKVSRRIEVRLPRGYCRRRWNMVYQGDKEQEPWET